MDRLKTVLDALSVEDWQKLAFAAIVGYLAIVGAQALAELLRERADA